VGWYAACFVGSRPAPLVGEVPEEARAMADKGFGAAGRRVRLLAGAFALITVTSARPVAAEPATCAVDLGLEYVPARPVLEVGDRSRVRLRFGAGTITGGSLVSVHTVRFLLQCDNRMSRLVPCEADRTVVAYGGDATITTTCPGEWQTGHAISARPNQVEFTPSVPLEIPAGTPAFCELEFDVIVLGHSRDATPRLVEQVAAVGFVRTDAGCDNGLRAAVAVGGGLPVRAP
jgi:hypothetical protein